MQRTVNKQKLQDYKFKDGAAEIANSAEAYNVGLGSKNARK